MKKCFENNFSLLLQNLYNFVETTKKYVYRFRYGTAISVNCIVTQIPQEQTD